jgi:hypothetical protein
MSNDPESNMVLLGMPGPHYHLPGGVPGTAMQLWAAHHVRVRKQPAVLALAPVLLLVG